MNNVLQNSLIALGGVALGITGFYLLAQGQSVSDNDSVTATITVPATVSLSDDGVNFSIANLTPGVADTSQSNVLTAASNAATGFNITVQASDLDGTLGQLCTNDGTGACDSPLVAFDTDNGTGTTGSRIAVTSTGTGGNLGTLSGATFRTAAANLGGSPLQVYTTTSRSNPDTLNVLYEAFTDFLTAAATYEGDLTFTISSN